MGKKRDIVNRSKHARVDDISTQVRIAGARNAIFESGDSFSSNYVQLATGDKSLTAIRVSQTRRTDIGFDESCRAPSLLVSMNMASTITTCSYQIFSTNLS